MHAVDGLARERANRDERIPRIHLGKEEGTRDRSGERNYGKITAAVVTSCAFTRTVLIFCVSLSLPSRAHPRVLLCVQSLECIIPFVEMNGVGSVSIFFFFYERKELERRGMRS